MKILVFIISLVFLILSGMTVASEKPENSTSYTFSESKEADRRYPETIHADTSTDTEPTVKPQEQYEQTSSETSPAETEMTPTERSEAAEREENVPPTDIPEDTPDDTSTDNTNDEITPPTHSETDDEAVHFPVIFI